VYDIEKKCPDIVILDIELNGSNGLDVLYFIKQDIRKPTVIIFTNYTNEVLKNRAIKNGAHYFLDKSADVDLLIDILIQLAK
jgi:DNA-binding NarL/FixJ family response regulator